MTVQEMAETLNLTVLQGDYDNRTVDAAYTSDLLSDVMGNAPDSCVLVTIQAHKNTVAVAVLKDSPAIIICNNRPVPDDMLAAALSERIAVFVSQENQFTVSGTLYKVLSCS